MGSFILWIQFELVSFNSLVIVIRFDELNSSLTYLIIRKKVK